MSDNKKTPPEQICAICGTTAEKCGNWVRCSIFGGPVCMTCCWDCIHIRRPENFSLVWCAATQKEAADG